MLRNRTVSELEFEFAIPIEDSYLYESLGEVAFDLRMQGMSFSAIGRSLGVTDKTAKKVYETVLRARSTYPFSRE